MVTVRGCRKAKRAITKSAVSRKRTAKRARTKREHPSISDPAIKALWDPKLTLQQNYSNLGLQVNPTPAVKNLPNGETMVIKQVEKKPMGASVQLLAKFEERAANPLVKKVHQADGEVIFIQRCIEKYGDDYMKMSRDIKLNTYQHTSKQLKHRCMKYLAAQENKQ